MATKTKRINIEFDDSKYQEFKRLMEGAGVSTQRELFDNALTLAKWMIKQKQLGKAIGSLNGDNNFTELAMPFLEEASAKKIDY
jgi:hypothetical protein